MRDGLPDADRMRGTDSLPPRDLVDAYVDGVIDEPATTRVRAAMDRDPLLAREVQRSRLIDDALKRRFRDEADRVRLSVVETIAAIPQAPPRRAPAWWQRKWVIAACLALLVGAAGITGAWPSINRLLHRINDSRMTAVAVYSHEVKRGFTPVWKCENDDEFAAAVRERLGEGLVLRDLPPNYEVIGWAYAPTDGQPPLSDQMMVLLARVDRHEVVVMIDRAAAVAPPTDRLFAGGSGNNVNVKMLGSLIAVEVTPERCASVLEYLHLQTPPDDGG